MPRSLKTISIEESEKLLDQFEYRTEKSGGGRRKIRNKCMTLLMLDAGLRVGEVVKIRRNCLRVFGAPATSVIVPCDVAKNHIQRTIPLTERLTDSIEDMKNSIWEPYATGLMQYAFYRRKPTQPLSRRQIQRIIAAASVRAFGYAIHPHVLRHTFATRLMRVTNARIVQELLGHKNITTTQAYTHPDADDMKQAIGELGRSNGPVK